MKTHTANSIPAEPAGSDAAARLVDPIDIPRGPALRGSFSWYEGRTIMKLQELGITKEEIVDRIIDRCCDRVLLEHRVNSEGDEWDDNSPIAVNLNRVFQTRVDAALAEVVDKHILPKAAEYIENVTLQETNKWGEKKGQALTFLEYLTQRAEAYLTEEVDYQGKTRAEDSYNWRASQTRIAYMVHQHLQYAIKATMEKALKTANSAIVGGIEKAVKIKLEEVAAQLKVEVKA